MNAQFAKPKAILYGSLLIALYFIFWIVVTVVLPILSLGLRLYTKEQGILKDHTQEPEAWNQAVWWTIRSKLWLLIWRFCAALKMTAFVDDSYLGGTDNFQSVSLCVLLSECSPSVTAEDSRLLTSASISWLLSIFTFSVTLSSVLIWQSEQRDGLSTSKKLDNISGNTKLRTE